MTRFLSKVRSEERRPSTFSDILAVFEYLRHKNTKQQVIDYLRSAGEIAAGATVFVGGATYPRAVSLGTGIVLVELEKRMLWDLLLHAKNLESRSMKEIEELPPFKPITKLVFFPRTGIYGIFPNAPVYISNFKPHAQVHIQGAVISSQRKAASAPLPTVSE